MQGFYPHAPSALSADFQIDIARGRIPGAEIRTVVAENPSVGGTTEHIWGFGGLMIYPVAEETWEIVSDSADDTLAGTGAQTVLVNYLDGDYVQQSIIVNMNGTTPVTLNADHFRPDGAVVIASGSGQTNAGNIEIRQQGTGNVRQYIIAEFANSQDSHYTVPAGKTLIALRDVFSYPRDGGVGAGVFRFFGTNTNVVSGEFALSGNIEFNLMGQFAAPEKTDFYFQGSAQNPGSSLSTVLVFIVFDNEFL